ncbi:MAG: NAD-dependent epimerase/dehydratase family protein [Actinobacteria bacterium]|nr:MAG: NAD-dependent epimerase/dehydratase family protein [Actinomycetota bacterium]
MKFVVTGAAGFIGSHLAERLSAQGHDVAGIDSFTDYYDVALKEENARGLDVQRLDLAVEDLELDGVHGVFHLAGQPGVRSFGDVFDEYVNRNLVASRRVFERAARAGVRVVFASSSSIYGDAERYPTPEDTEPRPISPYGITKLGCEQLARAYAQGFGLEAIVLRYFTVYGPRQRPDMAVARIVDALARGAPFELYGDGSQSRSFTYVADAVDGAIAAMERAPAGAVYNVGGGAEATMREAIDALERISGRTLELLERPVAKGDVRRTAADTTAIARDVGWRATTPLDDGLQAQWEWAANRVAAS